MNQFHIADLHCDLLSYLVDAPDADPMLGGRIGCTIPDLLAGKVKFQVMAIYAATAKGSVAYAFNQAQWYQKLINTYSQYFTPFDGKDVDFVKSNKITVQTAIENAAGLCEENEDLQNAFVNLNKLITLCGKPLYLGLTHHGENRFGGGNNTQIGLKDDGKALIDYLSQKNIALDFSHTSDVLAYDVLNYISKNNIQIPIMASHSNFRAVYAHARNLPDDIAKEIIKNKGLIGINLLRAFLNPDNENALYDHVQYGLALGVANNLCLGADYFYCDSHPDQTRKPFFFPNHEDAAKYPAIIEQIAALSNHEIAIKIANGNLQTFIQNNLNKAKG